MPSHHLKLRRSSNHEEPFPSRPSLEGDPSFDSEIAAQLVERLSRLKFDTSSIRTSVLDGVVTLTGRVPDRKSKYLIESIAGQIKGVIDVENLLALSTPPRNNAS